MNNRIAGIGAVLLMAVIMGVSCMRAAGVDMSAPQKTEAQIELESETEMYEEEFPIYMDVVQIP